MIASRPDIPKCEENRRPTLSATLGQLETKCNRQAKSALLLFNVGFALMSGHFRKRP